MSIDTNYRITLSNKKKLAEIEPQLKSIDTEITGIISDVDTLTQTVNDIEQTVNNIIGLKKSNTGISESRLQISNVSGSQLMSTSLQTNIDHIMLIVLKCKAFNMAGQDVTVELQINNISRLHTSSGFNSTNFYLTNLHQDINTKGIQFELVWSDFIPAALGGLHILGCEVYGI